GRAFLVWPVGRWFAPHPGPLPKRGEGVGGGVGWETCGRGGGSVVRPATAGGALAGDRLVGTLALPGVAPSIPHGVLSRSGQSGDRVPRGPSFWPGVFGV